MTEWTKERIKMAFDEYLAIHGRLPTAPEIDLSPDLPSSRQIQRKFGGLRKLREELGYADTDFGSGENRSRLASKHGKRGRESERLLEKQLIKHFGELFVHTEKYYGPGKNRVDFYVYTADGNFGIDIFSTETTKDMQKNINLKIDKYLDYPKNEKLYFAIDSKTLDNYDISESVKKMTKVHLIESLEIMPVKSIMTEISKFQPLTSPNNFTPLSGYLV